MDAYLQAILIVQREEGQVSRDHENELHVVLQLKSNNMAAITNAIDIACIFSPNPDRSSEYWQEVFTPKEECKTLVIQLALLRSKKRKTNKYVAKVMNCNSVEKTEVMNCNNVKKTDNLEVLTQALITSKLLPSLGLCSKVDN